MSFKYPFLQPGLILVEGKKPMLCILQDRLVAAQNRNGIDQVGGIEGGSAFLALVAISLLIAAMGQVPVI
jgi:hypothetical protein